MTAVMLVVEPRESFSVTSAGRTEQSVVEMMDYRRFADALANALGTEVSLCEDVLAACDTREGWVLADLASSSLQAAVDADDSLAGRLVLMGANRQKMLDAVPRLALAGAIGKGAYLGWRSGRGSGFGDGVLGQANRAQAAGLSAFPAHGATGCAWLSGGELPELVARYLRT